MTSLPVLLVNFYPMPGSCEFSADTNLKWYQKVANSLQVNNRAAYDKAVRDGWYGLGE